MKRVNLLPKAKQQELVHEHILYSITVAVVCAVIIMLSAVVVQFGVWTYLDRKIKTTDAKIDQLKKVANKTENTALKQEIRLINSQIADFSQLIAKTPQWSGVIAAFVKHVPDGVIITQFDGQTIDKEITISGFSPSRDLVIDLYNNINGDKEHFSSINYPLENVAQPTNVRFTFTFIIADGVLVKGSN
jgi:Tfp pilus assembly protein PilN